MAASTVPNNIFIGNEVIGPSSTHTGTNVTLDGSFMTVANLLRL